jgi:zinc/manganese transport system permease protein
MTRAVGDRGFTAHPGGAHHRAGGKTLPPRSIWCAGAGVDCFDWRTNIDLLHVLFGNILAMDDQTLLVIAFNATITLLVWAVIYRLLVIESVIRCSHRELRRRWRTWRFWRWSSSTRQWVYALGTLLAVGLMILLGWHRAFWSRYHRQDLHRVRRFSRHADWCCHFKPRCCRPAIILVAAMLYIGSVLFAAPRPVPQMFPAATSA